MGNTNPAHDDDDRVSSRPKRASFREADHFALDAARIMQAQIKLAGYTYKGLAGVLNARGAEDSGTHDEDTEHSLQSKIKRGRFSFAFFLRVMRAIGVDDVSVRETPRRRPHKGAAGR